jgi:hypothetical protein
MSLLRIKGFGQYGRDNRNGNHFSSTQSPYRLKIVLRPSLACSQKLPYGLLVPDHLAFSSGIVDLLFPILRTLKISGGQHLSAFIEIIAPGR